MDDETRKNIGRLQTLVDLGTEFADEAQSRIMHLKKTLGESQLPEDAKLDLCYNMTETLTETAGKLFRYLDGADIPGGLTAKLVELKRRQVSLSSDYRNIGNLIEQRGVLV